MNSLGTAPQMPPPKPFVPKPLTQDQKAFIVLAHVLEKQKRMEIRPTLPGVIGVGLLGAAAYLIWRRA